jgi:hypothetical protein
MRKNERGKEMKIEKGSLYISLNPINHPRWSITQALDSFNLKSLY